MFCIAEGFECTDDGNNFGYKAECDPDLNKYDTEDLKDLTKSGLGTAGREFAINVEFLVTAIIILFIVGLVGVVFARSKGMLGGTKM